MYSIIIIVNRSAMHYKNHYKMSAIPQQLHSVYHLSLTPQEVFAFYHSHTLQEMQAMMSLHDVSICNTIADLLQRFCYSRNGTSDAYLVLHKNEVSAYLYESKVFRSSRSKLLSDQDKEDNEFLSSFIIAFKALPVHYHSLYEFIQPTLLQYQRWVVKVKESALLRVGHFIRNSLEKNVHRNDAVVIPEEMYCGFISNWLAVFNPNYSYFSINDTLKWLFKGIFILMENQILLHYYRSLSQEERNYRRYGRAIKILKKPKNVEQFTVVEMRFGEIKWHTLKFKIFNLKYNIKEVNDTYQCYIPQYQKREEQCEETLLREEDAIMIRAFHPETINKQI